MPQWCPVTFPGWRTYGKPRRIKARTGQSSTRPANGFQWALAVGLAAAAPRISSTHSKARRLRLTVNSPSSPHHIRLHSSGDPAPNAVNACQHLLRLTKCRLRGRGPCRGADYTFPSPVNPVQRLDGERNPGREHLLARSRLVPGSARIMACAVPVDSNAGAQRQDGSPPGRACRFTRSRKQRKRRHRRKNDGRQQCAGCLQRRSQHAQPQRESGKHGKSSENKRYGPHREDLAPVAPPGMDRQRRNHRQHNGGPGQERGKNRALILQCARNGENQQAEGRYCGPVGPAGWLGRAHEWLPCFPSCNRAAGPPPSASD